MLLYLELLTLSVYRNYHDLCYFMWVIAVIFFIVIIMNQVTLFGIVGLHSSPTIISDKIILSRFYREQASFTPDH